MTFLDVYRVHHDSGERGEMTYLYTCETIPAKIEPHKVSKCFQAMNLRYMYMYQVKKEKIITP